MRITKLERLCGRSIVVEASEHYQSLAKCNPQDHSPLLLSLPREIRDLIWSFTTAPVEDDSRKYNANEYYCRPGHRAPHKTYTDLLYTCRRIWLEANALPMLQAEHCFWFFRAAPDSCSPEWMADLTELNRQNFGHLHLFAQMFAIESLSDRKGDLRSKFLKTPEQPGDFQPKELHVTIRHTDWWNWESEAPLRFKDSWFKAMLDSPDLRSTQTLKLELETLDYKVDQMMPIVERLKRLESKEYETHIVDGKPAKTKFVLSNRSEVYEWAGPANLDGRRYEPYEGKDTLKYHVVTLIWRLRFPELRRAHIPTLRRAPRTNAPEAPPSPTDSYPFDDPIPTKPRSVTWLEDAFLSSGNHSDARRMAARMRRRRTRGFTEDQFQAYEDPHWRHSSLNAQSYVRHLQKWQDDVRGALEMNRFWKGMAVGQKDSWEEKWTREGNLLSLP